MSLPGVRERGDDLPQDPGAASGLVPGDLLRRAHKQGISALQFQRDSGVGSYQTAWTLLHKVRSALGQQSDEPLRGWVEADESYVGSKRERGLRGGREVGHKTIVAVAVERRRHTAARPD